MHTYFCLAFLAKDVDFLFLSLVDNLRFLGRCCRLGSITSVELLLQLHLSFCKCMLHCSF